MFLPTLHSRKAKHPVVFKTLTVFSPQQSLLKDYEQGQSGWKPKHKPDDNDEVSSHPANESPDLP